MGRCGYSDDLYPLDLGRWRGQVAAATRGRRGQKFFVDLITALDALPEKRLVANALETKEGAVCGLGALGKLKGVDLSAIDTEDYDTLGETFNIAHQLAQETMYENDRRYSSDEERWLRVRLWAVQQLRPETLLEMGGAENG